VRTRLYYLYTYVLQCICIAAHAVTRYIIQSAVSLDTHTRAHLYVMPTTMPTPHRNNPPPCLRWGTRKKNGIKKKKKNHRLHHIGNIYIYIYVCVCTAQ